MAIVDIDEGEQLVGDYGTYNIESPMRCLCGAPVCRDMIYPEDILRFAPVWDASIRTALPRILEVPQPLMSWVTVPEVIDEVANQRRPLPSMVGHHYLRPARKAV